MYFLRIGFLIGLMIWAEFTSAQSLFNEEYRPQFHFSPQSGWIGDPDGLIKYQNMYHLFWWGHAVSEDLVHWQEKVYPMRGDDGSFSYYTGSVVVDKNNTSGFGQGTNAPMVAIYTAHNKTTGIQDQRISFSTDYELFQYYSGNPVLDLNSREFRDPDVFWHEATQKWIMCITLPLERKINLYSSLDLKSWEYMSSFGQTGAQEQVWEVPQLLHLPVEGNPSVRKWVMICSMGPNKMQYFPGQFDGTTFGLDAESESYLHDGTGIPGDVYQDFEDGPGLWTVEGAAFGNGAANGTLPDQTSVWGFLGAKLANSYHGGDASTGKMTSPAFTIEKNNINFLVGGGNNPGNLTVALTVNGSVVRSSTGHNSETLRWKGWDVAEFKGQEAQIIIVDNSTAGWGHIVVDHIMFSDVSMNFDREHALWIDHGMDFYAARAYRDYDKPDSIPVVWLGWMGNWEYANQTPTSWGRGAQSIPREIGLRSTERGMRLKQNPLPSLEQLRGEMREEQSLIVSDAYSLPGFPASRNTYELEAVFDLNSNAKQFGLNLFKSAAGKVVLGYDAATSMVYLDRRYSGNASFSSQFPKISYAPVEVSGNTLKFNVFVDQSSIEVFVNDGEVVLTSLVFPYAGSTGAEIFSTDGPTTVVSLKVWELSSIWGVDPPGPVTGVEEESTEFFHVYPNPLTDRDDTLFLVFRESTLPRATIVIRDSRGRVVWNDTRRILENRISLLPGLRPGLYFVDVQSAGMKYQQKLVIR